MPCCWHRHSSDSIIVLLLLALSIIMAMICKYIRVALAIWEKKHTFPISTYSSIVAQTTSAIFSPECSPISSRKLIRSSSMMGINDQIDTVDETKERHIKRAIIGHLVCNDGHKRVLIA